MHVARFKREGVSVNNGRMAYVAISVVTMGVAAAEGVVTARDGIGFSQIELTFTVIVFILYLGLPPVRGMGHQY